MQDDETTLTIPNHSSRPAQGRRHAPGNGEAAGVTLTGIDVPFVHLTVFFIKASLSMALALTLTSAVWVAVGGLLAGITVGGWLGLAAIFGPYDQTPIAPGTAPLSGVVAPPPDAPPEVPEPEPEDALAAEPALDAAPAPRAPRESAEAAAAATEAALRAEAERARQRRAEN